MSSKEELRAKPKQPSEDAMLATFAVINGAVIMLRYREPDVPRPFRIPGRIGRLPILPLLGVLFSLAMMSFVGWTAILVGGGLILSGFVPYLLRGDRRENRA